MTDQTATVRQHTPTWSDIDAMRAVYAHCAELNASLLIDTPSGPRPATEADSAWRIVAYRYPLTGSPYVCGLHTADNLQIITRKQLARAQRKRTADRERATLSKARANTLHLVSAIKHETRTARITSKAEHKAARRAANRAARAEREANRISAWLIYRQTVSKAKAVYDRSIITARAARQAKIKACKVEKTGL